MHYTLLTLFILSDVGIEIVAELGLTCTKMQLINFLLSYLFYRDINKVCSELPCSSGTQSISQHHLDARQSSFQCVLNLDLFNSSA